KAVEAAKAEAVEAAEAEAAKAASTQGPRTRSKAAAQAQLDQDGVEEDSVPMPTAVQGEDKDQESQSEADDDTRSANSRKRGRKPNKGCRPHKVPCDRSTSSRSSSETEDAPEAKPKKGKKKWTKAGGVNIDNEKLAASLALAIISQFVLDPEHQTMPRTPEFLNWAAYIRTLLSGHLVPNKLPSGSIERVVRDIQTSETAGDLSEFLKLVNYVHLAAMVTGTREKFPNIQSFDAIWKTLIDVSCAQSTFRSYGKVAFNAASLASAGSFYFLFILAVLQNRGSRNWLNLPPLAVVKLSAALRMPDPTTDLGDWIIHDIIPCMTYLHKLFRLKVDRVLKWEHLKGHLDSAVSCGDLVALDAYFTRFKSQSMTAQGRDMNVWAPFFEAAASTPAGTETSIDKAMEVALFRRPAQDVLDVIPAQDVLDAIPDPTWLQLPEPIPYPHVETCKLDKCSRPPGTLYSKCSEHDFVAIKTAYNPQAPANRREPYLTEAEPGLPPDPKAWTSKEMRFAEDAAKPTDLLDLAQKTHFDEDGVKHTKKYLRIHPELYGGKELMILDQDDKLIALIDGSISTHITRNLAARLKAALACSLKPEDEVRCRDSKKDEDRPFIALHFEIYARYCYKGDNFPVDVSPFLLVDEQNTPLPHTTLQPYESSDMVNNHEAFENLRAAWQMLFDHVRDKLSQHLPDEFEEVVGFANSLPHWTAPAAYPFSGFVVNLNVMTRSHRDTKDTSICLVLVLGEHEGGDLCLVEPGLTVKLREGDFIVFPSVFHGDKDGEFWRKYYGHWQRHHHWSSSQ
ncbi:hypothetical protein EUX98_g9633, partial [Antrodiella citrinella]